MKTKWEVRHRAKKIAVAYLKKRLSTDLSKLPENCLYNYNLSIHGHYDKSSISNVDISPRKSVSLVVIQPPKEVRICTYGSESTKWNGDLICDSEAVSHPCKLFQSKNNASKIFDEFKAELEDDDLTKSKYPDLAALQWVLGERFHNKIYYPFIYVWSIFVRFILLRQARVEKDYPELPKDLWDASDTKNS